MLRIDFLTSMSRNSGEAAARALGTKCATKLLNVLMRSTIKAEADNCSKGA
jgi:hypothetical protein